MGKTIWNDKRKFVWILSVLLFGAFIATSGISYQVAHSSLSAQIEENTLPLTSDNIYSEIQQDLLQPIFISSLMAQDTFVRDWAINKEQGPEKLIHYLREIQDKYDTVTSFFVSEKTRNYYHSSGILKQIKDIDPEDAWYFRVRSLASSELYEINIGPGSTDAKQTVVYVNYKVFDFEGGFIGITGVGLAVERVRTLIERYEKRYNRHVYFVDREGRITLHGEAFSGGKTIQDTEGVDKLATRILTSPSASLTYMRGGKTVYLNSRFVPEFKWYLMVEQEEVDSEKKLLTTFWANLAISFIVTIGILMVANLTLGRYQRKLEFMASTDKLTGVANRQIFEEYFAKAMAEADESESPVSIILLDIDLFKRVNDTYGHNIGDLVIKTVSSVLKNQLREKDVVCRWGGEEFLLLLPNLELSHAVDVAERIRGKIAKRKIRVNEHEICVTVSSGVAEYNHAEKPNELINRADVALYQAKELGRDQVVLSH